MLTFYSVENFKSKIDYGLIKFKTANQEFSKIVDTPQNTGMPLAIGV